MRNQAGQMSRAECMALLAKVAEGRKRPDGYAETPAGPVVRIGTAVIDAREGYGCGYRYGSPNVAKVEFNRLALAVAP